MDAEQFLHLASDLLNSPHPAAPRTVVGRAYYSLFNILAEFLKNYVTVRNDASGHKDVVDALKQCSDPQIYAIGSFLEDLRDARNKADYKLHLTAFDSMPNAKSWFDESRSYTNDALAIFGGQNGASALRLVQTDWRAWRKKLQPGD